MRVRLGIDVIVNEDKLLTVGQWAAEQPLVHMTIQHEGREHQLYGRIVHATDGDPAQNDSTLASG